MSNEANEKGCSTEDGTMVSHCDFLLGVNALLNGEVAVNKSGEVLGKRNEQLTNSNECCRDANGHSDSAIHSLCSNCRYKPLHRDEEKDSAQSSFSDYHSADGSQNVVSQSDKEVNSSQHECSSFMVLENDGNEQAYAITSESVGEKIKPTVNPTKAITHLRLGSEATSTPLECSRAVSRISSRGSCFQYLQDGFYKGRFKHKHGAVIDVSYDLTKVTMKNGISDMFCIRVYVDTTPVENCSTEMVNSTWLTNTMPSLSLSNKSSLLDAASSCDSDAEIELFEAELERQATDGEFSKKYSLVKQIGSGAFGFVQLAKCRRTSHEFVVKFIKKEKILEECLVHDDEQDSMIPLEIALLSGFNHPHIIQVFEFFENARYFSMIMPKHGIHSVDLFEFIERTNSGSDRSIDEPLCSYIFRQVVSAVSYLHAHSILHRDIKDENIIIDEKFTCKLIDFGSATFMKPGREFATFCGTIEYCSPEVLMGNRYRGPELEMWALGVTLYTLIFGENPFKDVEETVECRVDPPFAVTRGLAVLLQSLLHPSPELRCTMDELLESQWLNQTVHVEEYSWNDIVRTPAASSNSSIAEMDQHPKHVSNLDEENLCHQLQKLTTTGIRRQEKLAREPLADMNNTM